MYHDTFATETNIVLLLKYNDNDSAILHIIPFRRCLTVAGSLAFFLIEQKVHIL